MIKINYARYYKNKEKENFESIRQHIKSESRYLVIFYSISRQTSFK